MNELREKIMHITGDCHCNFGDDCFWWQNDSNESTIDAILDAVIAALPGVMDSIETQRDANNDHIVGATFYKSRVKLLLQAAKESK